MSQVAATVGGHPVTVADIDAREAALRAGRPAATLPRAGTSEGRQLRRWLTQLVVTERVLAGEAAALGLTPDGAPTEDDVLPDTTARLEIGSVAAAVLAGPLARAVYAHITAAVDVPEAEVTDYHARNPTRFDRHGDATPEQARSDIAEHLLGAARRRTFRMWLDQRCAATVHLVPGYEHPGDPRQPDNTHRH